jgi:methyl-accepting chemotaxis protein
MSSFEHQLTEHLLGSKPSAVSTDTIRRFTQAVVATETGGGGLELPGVPGETKKDQLLGYLVMGIRADRAGRAVAVMSFKTVLVTGIFLLGGFITFFLLMSARARRMIKFAETLAVGRLGAVLHDRSRDELGRLATALGELRERTLGVMLQLRDASTALASAASEVVRSADAQRGRANRQVASVAETGATVTELRQTFLQAKTKAEGVIELATASEKSSADGDHAVQQSVRAMEQMRDQVETTARTLASLVTRTHQIGAIIDVVNDLSEQSNMLALNAAIEAARAGEAGRGFAVVAREVRLLAERSQQSTAQVQAILADIEKAARESTAVVEESRRRAEAGLELAKSAGGTIRQLTLAIAESSTAAMQIAASTRQQGVGVEQIWQAMQEIDKSTQEATAGIQQLLEASKEINAHSDRMLSIVKQYRIPDRVDGGAA